jgi:hypothetical protein
MAEGIDLGMGFEKLQSLVGSSEFDPVSLEGSRRDAAM